MTDVPGPWPRYALISAAIPLLSVGTGTKKFGTSSEKAVLRRARKYLFFLIFLSVSVTC